MGASPANISRRLRSNRSVRDWQAGHLEHLQRTVPTWNCSSADSWAVVSRARSSAIIRGRSPRGLSTWCRVSSSTSMCQIRGRCWHPLTTWTKRPVCLFTLVPRNTSSSHRALEHWTQRTLSNIFAYSRRYLKTSGIPWYFVDGKEHYIPSPKWASIVSTYGTTLVRSRRVSSPIHILQLRQSWSHGHMM